MAILDKYNTSDVLGKYAGPENRNPTELNQYNTGQYNVSQYAYPEDLSTKADLQHYVAFYINIRQKTKFKPENKINVDVSSRAQNRSSSSGLSTTGTTGAAVGGLLAGAPVYPAVVASTPGRFNSDSAGSQKQPIPNVASRIAERETSLIQVGVDTTNEHRRSGETNENAGSANANKLLLAYNIREDDIVMSQRDIL